MKVVVSTHARNREPLRRLLWSLRSHEHLDDIIVSVAGVGSESFDAEEFAHAVGVRHVITHSSNIFEYTAFVSLREALWHRPELGAAHYVFIHDTVQGAAGFWDILAGFEAEAGVVWYPFCDNFNMGIAATEFIVGELYLAFRGVRLDKAAAIDIELNVRSPLNLRGVAGNGRWRYAFGGKAMALGAERPWANDTDVYGDGAPRCPTRVARADGVPFLYKFVHLHDVETCPVGFVWDFDNCCGKN
jgi:hypothetical protein